MQEFPWSVGDHQSFAHQFTREEVDLFARLTGDKNPIHLDANYARRTPVGDPVVHGMLAASFVSRLVGMHIPGPGALWNSFQINWRRMVRIGDSIRFVVQVSKIHPSTQSMDLEISGVDTTSNEICFEGKGRVMVMPREETKEPTSNSQKRILVTGATGELGKAICRRLASSGMRLILWGRDRERLSQLASELDRQVVGDYGVDLSDPRAIDGALGQVLRDGDIYGFIHVAAPPLSYVTVDDPKNQDSLEQHWTMGVAAFNRICQGLLRGMKQGGCIVHVLSQYTLDQPPLKMSAYVSAKMAAWGLIRAMAVELGPKGIRCNAVSPGMMNTPYSKDLPIRLKQVEAASNPMRRLCTVEDVAEAVAFLCGPQALFVNGVNLPVTGGARMP
jgi:3-oxoacyl-[acyl-carrier protein] reductase